MTATATETVDTADNTVTEPSVENVNANGEVKSEEVTEDVMGTKVEPTVEVSVKDGETLLGGEEDVKPFAPEKYEEFTLPDGIDVSSEEVTEFNSVAKELNLTQEQAQSLLDKQLAVREEQKQALAQEKHQQQEAWVDELKKDASFGGKNMSETVERANRTLRSFGDENIVNLLKDSGYGNNPSIIKMFAKIDKQIGEDKLVGGDANSMGEKSIAEQMFNHPTSK